MVADTQTQEQRSEQRDSHLANGKFAPGNQWAMRPGQTKNPNGRPPIAKALRKKLREPGELQGVVTGIVESAKSGDAAAFNSIRDTIDGKPISRIEQAVVVQFAPLTFAPLPSAIALPSHDTGSTA